MSALVYLTYMIHFFIVAGGLGQLGTGLARKLRQQYGTENIILSDIIRPNREILDDGKQTIISI